MPVKKITSETYSGKLRHGPRLKDAFFKKKLMLFKDVSKKSNEIWSTESIQNSGYSVKRSRDLVTCLTFKEGRQAMINRLVKYKKQYFIIIMINLELYYL